MSIKAWEMGDEVVERPHVPGFVKAKYMVTKVVPPKGKTIRDGLVISAALISYEDEAGVEIQTTKVTEGPAGFEVEFPLGKYMISATKYRGPKSWYNFVNPETGKWTKIPQTRFTEDAAIDYLKLNVKDWDTLTPELKEEHIDEYFEDLYLFGLACDFNFNTTVEGYPTPKPGMIVDFYRRYTPPAEDEKYGNTIITKWPSKKIEAEKEKEALDGTYEQKDSGIADAIITALSSSAAPKKFDPVTDDDDMPF